MMIAVEDKDLEALLVCARKERDRAEYRVQIGPSYRRQEFAEDADSLRKLITRIEESRAGK